MTKQTKNGNLKIKIHTPCSKSLFHELFEILTSIVYFHICGANFELNSRNLVKAAAPADRPRKNKQSSK